MTPESRKQERIERMSYIKGLLFALILSALPFGLLVTGAASGRMLVGAIFLAGLIQVVVHFRYFLHIDLRRSHRDDLQLILFSVLIVFLMVGGTLWVIGNQHAMMM
ncbi:cytochrome o ubiquinol oxidase subunit IV [Gluconobacter morbifer]|uniref:Cytochrome bo(3) ubiquinol oxidase subunit 4 n=1 Tax=Gluconobacter morbifer G707 TaxID=1088869 RepID=G6XJP0_9PROT|nr:cytochrome C oxidase subunit IV family protein [Gluconobacter morbifer]EHH67852.1 hypothetical protein GMO_16190 [Gluconobacter morbifer G707]